MKQRKGPFPHGRLVDMTGWRFGRLTVVRRDGNAEYGPPLWLCQCDCGNTHSVTSANLRNGGTLSCGCLYQETRGVGNYKHGLSQDPSFMVYHHMIRRCYDPDYVQYESHGGRGIEVCDEWLGENGLTQFWEDMGPKPNGHCLVRLNEEDDFCPENCMWAPPGHPARRRPQGKRLTWRGETRNLRDWADHLGMNEKTLRWRVQNWGEDDLDRVFLTPVDPRKWPASTRE